MGKLKTIILIFGIFLISLIPIIGLKIKTADTNEISKINFAEENTFLKIIERTDFIKISESVFALEIMTLKGKGEKAVQLGVATGFAVARDEEKGISYIITNDHVCKEILLNPKGFIHGIRSVNEESEVLDFSTKVDTIFSIVDSEEKNYQIKVGLAKMLKGGVIME